MARTSALRIQQQRALAAYPDATWIGIVTSVTPSVNGQRARISIANADGRLRPDMYATIAVEAGAIRALAVPVEPERRVTLRPLEIVGQGEIVART